MERKEQQLDLILPLDLEMSRDRLLVKTFDFL